MNVRWNWPVGPIAFESKSAGPGENDATPCVTVWLVNESWFVQTNVVPVDEKPQWFERIWDRVREEVDQGRQVYIVCPRISGATEDSDGTDLYDAVATDDGDEEARPRPPASAVEEVLPELVAGPLSGLRLDMLHGRMPAEAKDDVMARFLRGEVDVLVATTVIEVGVDVPNATVMVVLDADRFGVSQLHQLRGRIGRGEHAGLCLLVTHAAPDTEARERLAGVAATRDRRNRGRRAAIGTGSIRAAPAPPAAARPTAARPAAAAAVTP